MNRIKNLLSILVVTLLIVGAGVVLAQDDTPAFLGINFAEAEAGIEVTAVMPRSPAGAADLQVGDIITAVDGESVTADNVADVLSAYVPDDVVTLAVTRGDESLNIDVTLGARPMRFELRRGEGDFAMMFDGEAIVLEAVAEDSALYDAGLRSGDRITEINDTPVDDLRGIMRGLMDEEEVTLTVERDGETETITITADMLPEIMMTPMQFRFEGMPRGFMPEDFEMMPHSFMFELGENLTLEDVAEDSPLYEAGLRSGDQITEINGAAVGDMRGIMRDLVDEDEVTLTVERDGETETVALSTELVPELMMAMHGAFNFEAMPMPGFGEGRGFGFDRPGQRDRLRLGVQFFMLTEETAAEADVEQTEGAYIVEVIEGTPAADGGLQAGDIVLTVDGDILDVERTLADRLVAYEPGDTITLEVLRDGEPLELEITLSGQR